MVRKTITHAEILARAARSVEQEIGEWQDKAKYRGISVDVFASVLKPLEAKLEAIKIIYAIETGEDYE